MRGAVYARFVVAYLIIPTLTITLFMGCAYNKTARIEGVVLNARTKMPVSQGVVRMLWAGWDWRVVDSTITIFHSETAITDMNGRYVIPSYWFLKPFYRKLADMTLSVFHPLYVSWEKSWVWSPSTDWDKSYLYLMNSYGKNGVIHYDIDTVHIEDRYSKKDDRQDYWIFLGAERPHYLEKLKEKYGVRYNLQEIESTHANIRAKLIPSNTDSYIGYFNDLIKGIHEVRDGGY